MRGEAFYRGRPTSYWEAQIARWELGGAYVNLHWTGIPDTKSRWVSYKYSVVEDWIDRNVRRFYPTLPAILDDDSVGRPRALEELTLSTNPQVSEIVRERLRGTKLHNGTLRVYGGVGP